MNKEQFIPIYTTIEKKEIEEEEVLEVIKAKEKEDIFDANTYALLKGTEFHNGMIEVDVLSRLLPDAPDFARGFIGVAFRTSENNDSFECFYVRPTNGRECNDHERKQRGVQYFTYPKYTFSYYREKGITDYEAPAPYIALDEWIHLRILVHDQFAAFYVGEDSAPAISVELKYGDTRGGIGLYVDTGTLGYFKNLKITNE